MYSIFSTMSRIGIFTVLLIGILGILGFVAYKAYHVGSFVNTEHEFANVRAISESDGKNQEGDKIQQGGFSRFINDLVGHDDEVSAIGMTSEKSNNEVSDDANGFETQYYTSVFIPRNILKDVGEAYLDRFGLAPADFKNIKAAGFDTIEGNFDICAQPSDVVTFLDAAHDAGLKVILFAGAGEAEWGYPCDDNYSPTQKPVWQKSSVQGWVQQWSYHPALYAWDISNEDGQNFPNAQSDDTTWIERGHAISLAQLQEAYRDIKQVDSSHPVLIRMNGWFFYDYDSGFFREGNAFGKGVADIVMVNAYSNLIDEYFDDLVKTIASRSVASIHTIAPGIPVYISLGAWGEDPMWAKPSISHLKHDKDSALSVPGVSGIAIFKYGAEKGDWWMPRDASDLWNIVREWQ
jgi:hypothetical protein